MNKEEILQKIRECLTENDIKIQQETILEELDGWDSLGRLMIVSMLDEISGLKISTERIKSCRKAGDILRIIEKE